MSKELEALDTLKDMLIGNGVNDNINDYVNNLILPIKQALVRLEAIDKANPSEALECLEKLKGMEISSMPFSDEYGTQEVDLNDIRKVGSQLNTDFREYTTTIKQALLKAQEPKNYLKWEELDFSYGTKVRKVRMGDTVYKVSYRCCDDIKEVQLLSEDEKLLYISFVGKYKDNVQLFNDLHLERVEE